MPTTIKNSLTGFVHHDKFVGTKDEYLFYRVIDATSREREEKLFFDYPDEFKKWQSKNHQGKEYFLIGGCNDEEKKMSALQEKECFSDHL